MEGVLDTACFTIVQLVTAFLWLAVLTCPDKQLNYLFVKYLFNEDLVESFVSGLTFAPGLFQVLESKTPPTIAFFKTLAIIDGKYWGVYAIVLEKPGCIPLIYIGSGTHAESGIKTRMRCYDILYLIPLYMLNAMQDGYVITHKGYLCWMPIPSAINVPSARVKLVAVEGLFTFALWTLRAKTKYGYGMSHLCLWDREKLPYEGLCSHNTFSEGPLSGHDLTEAELLEKEAMYKKKKLESTHRYQAANPEKVKDTQKRVTKKAKDQKRYVCRVCKTIYGNNPDLQRHLETDRHAGRVVIVEKMLWGTFVEPELWCGTCLTSFTRKESKAEHLEGKRHATQVKLVAEWLLEDANIS